MFSCWATVRQAPSVLERSERAEKYLEQMRSALQIFPSLWLKAFYHSTDGMECPCLRGNLNVRHACGSGDQIILCVGLAAEDGIQPSDQGHRDACAQGGWRSIPASSEFRKLCSTIDLYQTEFMGLLVQAQIAFDGGDEGAGRDFLRKAMAWAESTDMPMVSSG